MSKETDKSEEATKSKEFSLSSIVNWITSHIWQSILIVLALFLFPLIAVHLLYKWYSGVWILMSTWESGDLIAYIAGFEAFLGSLFLGVVAVYQNKKAHELSARMLKNEETRDTFERQPSIMIHSWSFSEIAFEKIFSNEYPTFTSDDLCDIMLWQEKPNVTLEQMTLVLVNASKIYTEIRVLSIKMFSTQNSSISIDFNPFAYSGHIETLHIASGEMYRIGLVLDKKCWTTPEAKHMRLDTILANSIGEEYLETIEFDVQEWPSLFDIRYKIEA